MQKVYTFLMIAAFALVTVNSGWAIWGLKESLEGTVKSVSSDMLIITSQSEDGLRMREVTFEVNDQTKLDELASLGELHAGDRIKVGFKEEGDRKIATSVSRYNPVPDSKDLRIREL